jgi:Rod binding domain-containing protein
MSLSPIKALDPRAAAGAERAAPKDPGLARAAAEMESVFVRHLLEAAKIGGPSAQSGYGSMAVDALATGIEQGGGIGLARRIEESLAGHHGPAIAPAAKPALHPPASTPATAGTKAE